MNTVATGGGVLDWHGDSGNSLTQSGNLALFGSCTRALAFTSLVAKCFYDLTDDCAGLNENPYDDLHLENGHYVANCSDAEMPEMENAWTGLVLLNGHFVPEETLEDE